MIKDFFKCEPGARMTGDARRGQILATAVQLFSKHGFSGTTTKQIAAAAGVSEAMVFRHFSTKEELYGAILHSKACSDGTHKLPWEENRELLEAMERKDDFSVFYNLAFQSLNKQESDVHFMRLMFYSALEEHELAERFFTDFVSEVYSFIGQYIRQRTSDGAFREVDPKVVVRAFLGMMIHHSLNNILWDKKRSLLDISNEEAAKNFAEILLNGVRANNSQA